MGVIDNPLWGPPAVSLAAMPDLILQSQAPCPACHCKQVLNPHRMDRRKVAVLADLAAFRLKGDEWVRVEEGRGLQGVTTRTWKATAYCARSHAMRAEWFGLVEHRGPRIAEWQINRSGLQFLQGHLFVPAKILCTDGLVRYVSRETLFIASVRKVDLDLDYWNNYPMDDIFGADDA